MLRTFLKKILPWIVTAGIFVYLFSKYPPSSIWNSLKTVNILYFCAVASGYFLFMYLLDAYVITKILNHFGHRETFKEMLSARGLTYLIMVVNYAASQAAFAFYQKRKHNVPISEMLGIFGIIVVIDLAILTALAFVTTFFTTWPFEMLGMNIGHFVRLFALIVFAGFVVNILFWKGTFGKISFLEKMRKKDFFSVLSKAGVGDYLSVAFWRLPVHIFIMVGMYFAIKPFNANVPFVSILANIPLVFFIGALPISPGGLGTSNAALVELFKPFITAGAIDAGFVTAGELLLSFSLVWMFANYLMKALTGVICLKFISKDLFKATTEVKEEVAIPDVAHLADDL
ncbi:MAG: flippase-like domain-containing protein [Deltaproteobacteria bacterium]|nr:flippase-like domain-containing protein [Deltaproteobacteria bacterium]MBI2975246.1 flippase-like domain-containing protein [Deltaproteobacteria bacterium]